MRQGAAVAMATLGALLAAGCYRVEYHVRPAYYEQAAQGELPSEVTLKDGTVVKFIDEEKQKELRALARGDDPAARQAKPVDRDGDGKPDAPAEKPQIWQENEDGTVTMRATMPEHVIANLMQSLRQERYVEFWRQMMAERTREIAQAQYPTPGEAEKRFAGWARKHRKDLMATLNRIGFGYLSPDVLIRKHGREAMTVELTPKVTQGGGFKFTELDIQFEKGLPRLGGIR
jgi:hypothetical protein